MLWVGGGVGSVGGATGTALSRFLWDLTFMRRKTSKNWGKECKNRMKKVQDTAKADVGAGKKRVETGCS
jgi:hypothetical protein